VFGVEKQFDAYKYEGDHHLNGKLVLGESIADLGGVAIAAVGASLQFKFLFFPVFNALSIGTVALVSRRMGERRAEAASGVVRQSLVLGAALGVLTGALFAIFAKRLLMLIGADETVSSAGAPDREAIQQLRAYLASYDDEGNGFGRLALALERLGRVGEAKEALNAGIARRRTSAVIASVAVSSTQTCASARHKRTAATAAQIACATRVTRGRLLP